MCVCVSLTETTTAPTNHTQVAEEFWLGPFPLLQCQKLQTDSGFGSSIFRRHFPSKTIHICVGWDLYGKAFLVV